MKGQSCQDTDEAAGTRVEPDGGGVSGEVTAIVDGDSITDYTCRCLHRQSEHYQGRGGCLKCKCTIYGPRLYTTEEVARKFRVKSHAVLRWRREGKLPESFQLPGAKPNEDYRYIADVVDKMIGEAR